MSIVNSLRTQVDLPVWEWCRFAPAVSSALSSSCAADNSLFHWQHGRYIYYLIAAAGFWRYDTWADMYQQLSSPPIAPVTASSMRFGGAAGVEGLALAGGASTITIPGYYNNILTGFDLRIISGTGAGQRRTITSVADPVVADSGVATAVANALGGISITDSTKAWVINNWVGYNCRITFGSGIGQVRRIIANTATTLTFADSTMSATIPSMCNPAIFAPAIAVTAGVQSMYSIESSVATVNANWDTQPDATSQFRIMSGCIYLASVTAATPFYSLQRYCIATDTWYILTTPSLGFSAALTDISCERQTENASVWNKGIASSTSTNTTLIDATKSWTVNQWAGYYVYISSGTGEGTLRPIASNTATQLTWSVAAGSVPDITTNYLIFGFEAGTSSGAGSATTLVDATKSWATDRWAGYAVRILWGTGKGSILPIVSNNGTTLTVTGTWLATPDNSSVYVIQGDNDKIFLVGGGQASVLIHNIADDIPTFGRWQDSGVARIASVAYANQRPVAITSATKVGTTATVVTAIPHGLKVGWSVTVRGFTDANYNTTAAIATVPSATSFTYVMAGIPAVDTIVGSHSVTTLCDATQNWTVNQWAGYMCYMNTTAVTAASGVATGQALQIASNTATTLTFVVAGTAPVNGVSRYVIAKRPVLGSIEDGIATGGGQSTTALQDTGKAWVVNIHAGKKLKFLGGTGQAQELTITSNTANTLSFAAATAPVAGSSSYVILQQGVRGLGTNIQWVFGSSDINKRGKFIYMPRGGATHGFDRINLNTDKVEQTSISPQIETLTTGSQYAYDGEDRIYFTKEATQRVYYLDTDTGYVHGAGMYPYVAPTAVLGNRMEIFETPDGLKYLWINRMSFTECFRTLLIW